MYFLRLIMIVVVSSEKGGTGKTTIATNLAIIRTQKCADVFFVDSDTQKSATDFFAVRNELCHEPSPCCAGIFGQGTYEEIRKMSQKFDDVIVDVGGRDTTTLRKALLIADKVIVPFIPSQLDVWGLDRMDEIIGEAQIHNESLKAICVMNRVDTNPKITFRSEAESIALELKNIKFTGITIGNRVSYRRSVAEGISVTELKSKKDDKAVSEIMKLYNEVFEDD